MAKKCIPGVICVENMTLFVLILLSISVAYLYYKQFGSGNRSKETKESRIILNTSSPSTFTNTGSELQNLYVPPLNTIDVRGRVELPPFSHETRSDPGIGVGIPVNIRTSSANTPYRQIGILTKNVRSGNGTDPLILPLFGRSLLNGRDKWQYYTVANSGGVAFNAKLPISVNGRSCTSEYGCDSVSNGDTVYVEGYEDTFRATIYENATLNYIPF
jgi:hypothetical protein